MGELNKLSSAVWLDSLIPDSALSNAKSRYRARLFLALFGFFVIVILLMLLSLAIFPDSDFATNNTRRLDRSIFVFMAFFYGLSGYLFFVKQRLFMASCLVLMTVFGGIAVGSYLLVHDFNILSYVLLILPIVGFLLVGTTWGFAYALLVVVCQVYLVNMYVSQADDFTLFLPSLADKAFAIHIFMTFMLMATVFAAVILYELTLNSLSDQLEVERLHYRIMEVNDDLADLPGKEAFESKVEMLIKSKVRFAIVYLDIDSFKRINHIYGPKAGNELLAIVGRRLKAAVRGDDFVARIDGDQFAIILKDVVGRNKALERDEEIYKRLIREISFSGQVEKITISRGLALYPDDERTYKALMSHADASMYEQKQHAQRN